MRITEKQIWQLYQIAYESVRYNIPIAFSQEDRKELVESILNQQETDIKEIKIYPKKTN